MYGFKSNTKLKKEEGCMKNTEISNAWDLFCEEYDVEVSSDGGGDHVDGGRGPTYRQPAALKRDGAVRPQSACGATSGRDSSKRPP